MRNPNIDKHLARMHARSGVNKGNDGELAAFAVCEDLYSEKGGILYHSFEYKTDSSLCGNIKMGTDGHLYLEKLSSTTELDILYVTPYHIFPIEVKAYRASNITLTDDAIKGASQTTKSPVHQNEMHCRHLYSWLYTLLPNGQTKYIVPIVCFVDKCKLVDKRSDFQKGYIKVAVLNTLAETISKFDYPEEYRLDLESINQKLIDIRVAYKNYMKKI